MCTLCAGHVFVENTSIQYNSKITIVYDAFVVVINVCFRLLILVWNYFTKLNCKHFQYCHRINSSRANIRESYSLITISLEVYFFLFFVNNATATVVLFYFQIYACKNTYTVCKYWNWNRKAHSVHCTLFAIATYATNITNFNKVLWANVNTRRTYTHL